MISTPFKQESKTRTQEYEQMRAYAHVAELLDGFYADRETTGARLVVKRLQPGTYRIEPCFSCAVEKMPTDLKAYYLECGKAEMQAFTTYLKQRFFTRS